MEPSRSTVAEHIKRALPYDYEKVLSEMEWSHLDGCWYRGMLVGIETDGYIHS